MHKLSKHTSLIILLLLNGVASYAMQPSTGLLDLPSELDQHISSYTHPKTIGNLSITCHRLHEKISFQTPHIWNIVCHSLDCISDNKMPLLLIKARLCQEHTTDNKEKDFLKDIEKKILERYTPTTFKSQEWHCPSNSTSVYFDPFLENQGSKKHPLLFSACFTNDINIVYNELLKNNVISDGDLFCLRYRLMEKEQTLILSIICTDHASL